MQSDGTITELPSAFAKELRKQVGLGEDPDLVEIPAAELVKLQAMNRHDRRAWHAKARKERRAKQRRAKQRGRRD